MAANIITGAVLIIGNEILSGRTQDTNFNDIAQAFAEKGITLEEGRIIADETAEIIIGVRALSSRYDYVITTGGIGPTHDDITAAAIAEAFELPLALNEDAHQLLKNYYGTGLNEARLRMAYLPETALLIENPISGAPGFRIKNVFVLAGVPVIMRAMLDHVMHQIVGGDIKQVVTLSFELAEGELAEGLSQLQNKFTSVEIGSYPWFKKASLGVHLVLRSYDNEALQSCAAAVRLLAEAKQSS